ncbi:MAG TPA: hypothetical protein VMU29_07030 [Smithella sp.]|nr:hypothetical protein [Smithella sp.]
MNKLKNVSALFLVLFLTLVSLSCAKNTKPHETIYHDENLLNGLKIINYGGFVFPDPFDTVKYTIDGKKVATHNADNKFEKLIELPPGDHQLIVDNGRHYKCKYKFRIYRGQIGIFNNYDYYTAVMYQALKEEADKAERDMAALAPWGFQDVNAQVMDKKIGDMNCYKIENKYGKAICHDYYDSLCR